MIPRDSQTKFLCIDPASLAVRAPIPLTPNKCDQLPPSPTPDEIPALTEGARHLSSRKQPEFAGSLLSDPDSSPESGNIIFDVPRLILP